MSAGREPPAEPGLDAREAQQVEQDRRHRIQAQRLVALRRWFSLPRVPVSPPEKYTCLACHGVYARGEPGSTWRFCAACRQGPRKEARGRTRVS
jgi:hypothetical protein